MTMMGSAPDVHHLVEIKGINAIEDAIRTVRSARFPMKVVPYLTNHFNFLKLDPQTIPQMRLSSNESDRSYAL